MISPHIINAIDVHAEGEPGRVLTGSYLQVKGTTMADRLRYCAEHLDGLRQLMLHEPRGYPAMCANLILPAVDPKADFGLVVAAQGGFRPMSGSNVICAVTALLETGMVEMVEPVTKLNIDTAVGLIEIEARCRENKVTQVTVRNVPSFVVSLDHPLDVPEFGVIHADIVFGGQFFAQVRAAELDLEVSAENAKRLTQAGTLIHYAAAQQLSVSHPENPDIDDISLVMIHEPADEPHISGRNTVIIPSGAVDLHQPDTWTGALDRSPCGTGTCARMAALYEREELSLDEAFVHQSILGTLFRGRLLAETKVGTYDAVVPSISGQGWVTGLSQYVLDASDPFPQGYTLGDL